MQTFIKSSYINCDIKTLFNFHLNTNNITKITPNDTKVQLLTKDFKPQVSQILKIKSTKYFIPMMWEVKIEKIEEALYKDFDDDVKEYQSGHSNDVAEQVAGQCIQCGSFDIRYKTQNSYYARTAACMHGYHAGHDVVKQDILVRYVECQVCRYQEHISNTKIGEPYIECYGFN